MDTIRSRFDKKNLSSCTTEMETMIILFLHVNRKGCLVSINA